MIELDMLDRRLAHALQVDGRASFSRLAAALGVSDQTVARRYTRLRSSRALRVVGLTDVDTIGVTQWLVRIKAAPEAADPIAQALSRRSDTSWVILLAGGTEIVCSVTTHDSSGSDLLLSTLPRTNQVLDVTAQCRLHQFFGGRQGAIEMLDLMSADELTSLARVRPATTRASVDDLDDVDRAILRELAIDGRTSTEHLTRATSCPASTVRRRIDSLVERGVLYFDVELDNRLLGNNVEAVLWVTVSPSSLHEAGVALGSHREVAFAAAYTGTAALVAYVSVSQPRALYAYLTSSVACLPGVLAVETAPALKTVKGPGALLIS